MAIICILFLDLLYTSGSENSVWASRFGTLITIRICSRDQNFLNPIMEVVLDYIVLLAIIKRKVTQLLLYSEIRNELEKNRNYCMFGLSFLTNFL